MFFSIVFSFALRLIRGRLSGQAGALPGVEKFQLMSYKKDISRPLKQWNKRKQCLSTP
jgi:hypothetical protein